VILAAQKYGDRGVGVEIDPRLVEVSLTYLGGSDSDYVGNLEVDAAGNA
jgi:hypothetical protein